MSEKQVGFTEFQIVILHGFREGFIRRVFPRWEEFEPQIQRVMLHCYLMGHAMECKEKDEDSIAELIRIVVTRNGDGGFLQLNEDFFDQIRSNMQDINPKAMAEWNAHMKGGSDE